jgi:hypothetical protein
MSRLVESATSLDAVRSFILHPAARLVEAVFDYLSVDILETIYANQRYSHLKG